MPIQLDTAPQIVAAQSKALRKINAALK